MKLSVIIVNYNTYSLTKQTIYSVIKRNHNFDYEIILVDNASTDGSIEQLQNTFKELILNKRLNIHINSSNLGFAKANNIGMRLAKGQYILLLNSDTEIKDDCLEKCLRKISEDITIGALGCKVMLADNKLDHACKRGFPTPKASLYYFLKLHKRDPLKYGEYNASYLNEDEVGEVDSLTGAFMLMPKDIVNKIGGLDEEFFMYGEDIDLCYRIKESGYKVLYYPKAKIIHYKGGSSKKKRTKVIYDFHNAMWIFYKKHYFKQYNIAVSFLVYLGIRIKYLLEISKNALK